MKIFIDIPGDTVERATAVLADGGYRSLSEFLLVALENQVSLELGSATQSDSDRATGSGESESRAVPVETTSSTIAGQAMEGLPAPEESRLTADEHGWLSGFINRLLPVKVAARSLLKLQARGLVTLEELREAAAEDATILAKRLAARGADNAPRDESILIGLPAREPLFRAKRRFADHFVGRADGEGVLHGALFELGLAALEARSTKRVGLTDVGRRFAELSNPVMDEMGPLHSALSTAERDIYLAEVALGIPRERSAFHALLAALTTNAQSVSDLDSLAAKALRATHTRDTARSAKTAAIGRMRDLDLVSRERAARGVYFHATDEGRAYYKRMVTAGSGDKTVAVAPAARRRR